ncbi:hypothetical protein AAFX19_03740 [Vibrio harveyi]|uniref:hypothetical protein n=1 Tax=Vibrio TaxID=662 RepID=UPI0010BE2BAF|nr:MULTISPECIES: hypothetical protein [Vibrio]MCR9961503.1 hypothetical protein [Vibrio alginolyticus]TKF76100.1 hypothetical protein FCV62_18830 [Vibrio kanaloae]
MVSSARVELYEVEKSIQQAYVRGSGTEHLLTRKNKVAESICPESSELIKKYLNQMLPIVKTIKISSSVLQESDQLNLDLLSNQITKLEFEEAKRYVQELLDVDLTGVDMQLTSVGDVMVEGMCLPCSNESHIVLIPENSHEVSSTDLLVHELGHAAEFTIARSYEDDKLLVPHASFSETVAYYCQLKYLKEKGTKEQRIGAFGAFYLTYLTACVVRHCLNDSIELLALKPNKALKSGYYDDILGAYPKSGINEAKKIVISNIKFFQEHYGSLIKLMHGDFSPRLGFIFALFLLDKPIGVLQDLITKNSLQNDFFTVSQTIVPDLKSYSELDNVLLSFYG